MSAFERTAGSLRRLWLSQVAKTAVLFKRPRAALAAYQQMLEIDPEDAHALAMSGYLLGECGDTEGSVASFRRALELRPEHAESWFNLAYVHEKRGELDDAERCFRQAVKLQPSLDRAWYGLGLVLIRAGRLNEAVDALKKNTQLQPFNPYGWYQLGMTHHHLGQTAEAQRIQLELQKFEPKYAAALERDLQASGVEVTPQPRRQEEAWN